MAKAKTKARKAKAKSKARKLAGTSVVRCALCGRPLQHESAPGKAAEALTGHYNDAHLGDGRLNGLAGGTREVQRVASPAYL